MVRWSDAVAVGTGGEAHPVLECCGEMTRCGKTYRHTDVGDRPRSRGQQHLGAVDPSGEQELVRSGSERCDESPRKLADGQTGMLSKVVQADIAFQTVFEICDKAS